MCGWATKESNSGNSLLKGQCHEIFCFCFFHESVSPQPQSIPLGPFQIFSKICGDISKSRCTTGINHIDFFVSLVPFQGPKKSRFSGPTPSNAPRNDVALLKSQGFGSGSKIFSNCGSGFWFRIPDPDPGFDDLKLKKNLQLEI